jgi:hypothetical protein
VTKPSSASSVVVDIVDVVPEAVRTTAAELKVGDKVFDAFGGTHELKRVRTLVDGTISTKRDDHSHFEHWDPTDTITIIRTESEAK